jgi:transcriptional regulator with XRE-family HTH domain
MTLDEYLRSNNITEQAFADLAGCSQGTINKIRNGNANPTMALLEAIRRASNGAVTPNDYLPFRGEKIAGEIVEGEGSFVASPEAAQMNEAAE